MCISYTDRCLGPISYTDKYLGLISYTDRCLGPIGVDVCRLHLSRNIIDSNYFLGTDIKAHARSSK